MIELTRVTKEYALEAGSFAALKETDLTIGKGEFVALMGPSGSGKSTLLQLIGGLDQPTSGSVTVAGIELTELGEKDLTQFRRAQIGFVFQNYQLLPMMTVAENVALPLAANAVPRSEAKDTVARLLMEVGLSDKASHYPSKLSGGQQQRVAIARALAMKPRLLLADEPTGNLDRATGAQVLQLLKRLNQEEGITIVMVTHDLEAAKAADRIIRISDGEVLATGKGGAA